MAKREYPHLRVETAADGAAVVHLVGCTVLDEVSGPPVGEELLDLAGGLRGARLLLDMGPVEYLTSTMLGILVRLHRRLRDSGGSVALCNLTPTLYEVFETTHLNRVFEVRPQA